jgi:hypothetical protein
MLASKTVRDRRQKGCVVTYAQIPQARVHRLSNSLLHGKYEPRNPSFASYSSRLDLRVVVNSWWRFDPEDLGATQRAKDGESWIRVAENDTSK